VSPVDPVRENEGTPPVSAESLPPRLVEAVVQTGTVETPYRRAGSGVTVLLLTGGGWGAGAADGALFRVLAERHRVIEPGPCPTGRVGSAEWASWLRNLLDGLGLELPRVVADPSSLVALEAFDRLHPGRLGTLFATGAYETIDV
jgi:hypothetical protein